jgi:hypothetical protein
MAKACAVRMATKLLIAAALILTFAGKSLFPAASTLEVMLWGGAGLTGLVVLAVLLSFVVLSINQAALRAGGTDTQWLWFNTDPPGLDKLRGRPDASTKADA